MFSHIDNIVFEYFEHCSSAMSYHVGWMVCIYVHECTLHKDGHRGDTYACSLM
eukprot:m.367005 g.367005  ORF g.367005 m.367005 type:complete len:53 (-) comp20823_c0_seq44:487-645(-)